MHENPYLHEIVVTVIIVRDDKYLITRRAKTKKRFPGKWVVPGGRLEATDYTSFPKDTEHWWYNILEKTAKREIQEEVGLSVDRIQYVTSLARIHEDGAPSLVISVAAEYTGGEPVLDPEETDEYAWVTLEEAKAYDLIEGVYEELLMTESLRRGVHREWEKVITT